jgi:tetraacyldisaccharide 4'-kinase
MFLLRLLLLPFTLLYGFGILLRNLLYSSGVFTRMDFDFPIVCVGNLSAGGTGKTPHIEWLLANLPPQLKAAILSRGYLRKTSGYILADAHSTAADIGDEPLQMKHKFPDVPVAACANRVLGVPQLLADAPNTNLILMDDGFQHLGIRAGFNIVLTPAASPFYKDWLLPFGRLREYRNGYKRAQAIVVTKCEEGMSKHEQEEMIRAIAPLPEQEVYFTGIKPSQTLHPVFEAKSMQTNEIKDYSILAFAGIANPDLFTRFIKQSGHLHQFIRFSDHHTFTEKELKDLGERFELIQSEKKIILTTEKDAKRIQSHPQKALLEKLPFYYLPIEIVFINDDGQKLIQSIVNYVNAANTGSN